MLRRREDGNYEEYMISVSGDAISRNLSPQPFQYGPVINVNERTLVWMTSSQSIRITSDKSVMLDFAK